MIVSFVCRRTHEERVRVLEPEQTQEPEAESRPLETEEPEAETRSVETEEPAAEGMGWGQTVFSMLGVGCRYMQTHCMYMSEPVPPRGPPRSRQRSAELKKTSQK